MKIKFTLSLSEAQWPFYPRQSGEESETEFTVDLKDGPWVQFTYGALRDQEGGENFGDLTFGGDGMIHHAGRVYSDLVVEFVSDAPSNLSRGTQAAVESFKLPEEES